MRGRALEVIMSKQIIKVLTTPSLAGTSEKYKTTALYKRIRVRALEGTIRIHLIRTPDGSSGQKIKMRRTHLAAMVKAALKGSTYELSIYPSANISIKKVPGGLIEVMLLTYRIRPNYLATEIGAAKMNSMLAELG